MQDNIPASAAGNGAKTSAVAYSAGGYYWYYELNMFKNPTVFLTLLKVFGGIIVALGLIIGLLAPDGFVEKLRFIGLFWAFGLGGFLVLGGLSYCIYAAIMGGKYCVLFEMDDKAVTHTQLARQFGKAQVMTALATIMGAAAGSITVAATGILAGSRGSMTTKFKQISKITYSRRRNVIYLKSGPSHNQIYVPDESFDFVLGYIKEHTTLPSENR